MRRLAPHDVDWALTGSVGHALQGAELVPRDLDVQTDARGARLIVDAFPGQCVRPLAFRATDRIRSHLGALRLDDVEVEVMGAVQTRLPDGSWTDPVDVRRHRTFAEFRGAAVPVMSLEHEIRAYERLGRLERVAVLRRALETRRGRGGG